MISQDLKNTWRDVACAMAQHKLDKFAVPATGAFSLYLGRLFKRETLAHIDDSNIGTQDNLLTLHDEIQKDVNENKPSTGTVAKFVSEALPRLRLGGL